LLIFIAAEKQKAHDWRRCRFCSGWFDRHGTTTSNLTGLARFALHGEGMCPKCSQEREKVAASVPHGDSQIEGMKPSLAPPDTLHILAAQGWLELGDHIEANEELENITPELRAHPAVLAVRWEIYAAAKKWEATLEIAAALILLDPDDPLGWVHRSYALHELKRTAEARDNLLRVVDRFPASATMRYNLACYECQLGRLEQARDWLAKAFKLGNAKKMKLAALDDPDLEPLWKEIGKT
jgi:tetratricopeptide (TPR) repeat protein